MLYNKEKRQAFRKPAFGCSRKNNLPVGFYEDMGFAPTGKSAGVSIADKPPRITLASSPV